MSLTREIVLVCGVTGSGKTTWARHFTQSFARLFVYDIAVSFPVTYYDGKQIAQMTQEGMPKEFRIGCYSPYDTDVLTAAAYMTGRCWLVLEEISTLFNIGARIQGPLQEVTLLGRQRAVSILAIAQRLSYIPITLRSQASRIISYRQQEPADVKALSEIVGKTEAEKVLRLPDFHCMDWHKGNITFYSVPDIKPTAQAQPGIEEETDTDTNTHTHTDTDNHAN